MAKWNPQIDSSVVFWKEMICEASAVDYGVPLPKLDSQFLETWSSHYAHIASLSQLEKGFLEIGTGFGVLAAGLGKKYGVESWTIEHPSRAYFYAPAYREFLKKYGVNLVGADLCTGLPFRSGKISKVYLCDVIEHLNPVYVPYTLKEIQRVLEPGGSLILSTPNLNRLANLFRFLLGYSVNPPLEVKRYGDTYGHIREFAPRELRVILKRYGFEVLKICYGLNPYFTACAFDDDNIFSARAERLINRLTRICKRFYAAVGDEIFLLARK